MAGKIWLTGVLSAPQVAEALGVSGTPTMLAGRLLGGAGAGVTSRDWPVLAPHAGETPALQVDATPTLLRYAEVVGLAPVDHAGGRLLGIAGIGGEGAPYLPANPDLAAEVARAILATPDAPVEVLARRLPQIATVAASTLRGRAMQRPRALLPPPGRDGFELLASRRGHAGYYATDTVTLRHARHDGGMIPAVTRDVFSAGDAVVVLPWDRARDRVLVIDQFRPAMAVRGEALPWMIEAIAGRIDPGETPAHAAIREAEEEANLVIAPEALIEGPAHYPSPGLLNEYLYSYVAMCDLPDGIAGVAGLDSEAEDIRAHLLPRAGLTAMAQRGALPNGPLALLALWLEVEAAGLRAG